MSGISHLCAFGAVFVALALPARPQAALWNNPSGGAWTTASDWDPAEVPGALDSVQISLAGSYTVTLRSAETIQGFTLDDADATLALSGSALRLSSVALGSSTISAGTVSLSGGEVVTTMSGSGAYVLTNAGVIRSTSGNGFIFGDGGAGTGMSFVNTGTVSVTGGSLGLGNGLDDRLTNAPGGVMTASRGATLNLNGGSAGFANQGSVTAAGGIINIEGPFAITTDAVSIRAAVAPQPAEITNTGTLEADGPTGVLTLSSGSTPWTNPGGVIGVTHGGTVDLAGTFTDQSLTLGTISVGAGGGTLAVTGTLTNAGVIGPPDGGGIYTLEGGSIEGGAVDGTALTFSGGDGTLSGVTMTGNFLVPKGARFTVDTDTTFADGLTIFAGDNRVHLGGNGTALTIASSGTWVGNVNIAASAANLAMVNNGTLVSTVSSLVSGGGNNGFAIANFGLIESTGGTLSLADGGTDVFTNSPGGTVEADGGNVTLGLGSAAVANLSGETLTGGRWIASGGSTLAFASGDDLIATNGASTTITLIGPGSAVTSGTANRPLEQTLTTNNGALEILANRDFVSTSGGITNIGTLRLGGGTLTAASLTNGSGATLSGFGTLNPTGGVTVGPGVLISPGSAVAGHYVGTLSFGGAGTLGPGGAYTFDLTSSASPVAGTDNDTLTVGGTLTVGATPASPFTLSVESVNPVTGLPGLADFNPTATSQWTLISAASLSNFNATDFTINTSLFQNGMASGSFSLSSNGADLFLDFKPIPEPSSWALIGAGLAALALGALRRRRRLRPA